MTAIPAPAAVRAAGPGPRPKGLLRAVLRLHRTALVGWGLALLAAVSFLFRLAALADEAERGNSACAIPAAEGLPSCAAVDAITADETYSNGIAFVTACLAWLIFPVAAWAGGALIGRELENGTARLAWTQSVTPAHWLTAKLAVPAVLLTLGTTALVLLGVWARGADNPNLVGDWYYPDVYVGTGPTAVAYALTGLALGALAGMLLGRALPAAGAAFGAALLLFNLLERHREDLWPTVTRSTEGWEVPRSAFQVTSSRTELSYHPPSHFWPVQYVESGILLATAGAAVAGAYWLLRRRTT
ncbi:hypothetical protein BN159_4773 [Streptomyces davaonensis JCM 4913]|uniref:ABC transporter transmembrane protein n=1 Tax=Streptomyces davaonensis (strain DSM 101723 / JCM 4913 / KCC S-0913 / 768) TaxID=1214101 RepID=K4R7Q4_STRDJ|nr:hypothetical protein [Streptomyces davaonensis]CCK29152.1 hypothetical protein BN159_4773 [Streptomyces davaonensis JCM 4913]